MKLKSHKQPANRGDWPLTIGCQAKRESRVLVESSTQSGQ